MLHKYFDNTFDMLGISYKCEEGYSASSSRREGLIDEFQVVPCVQVHNMERPFPFRDNAKDVFLTPFDWPEYQWNRASIRVADEDCNLQRVPIHPPSFVTTTTTINVVHQHYPQLRPVFLAPPKYASPNYSSVPMRPTPVPVVISETSMSQKSDTNQKCHHCGTEATSLWRRIEEKLMCNACALYYKLHGFNRPLHLNTGIVKRRNRIGSAGPRRQRRHKC